MIHDQREQVIQQAEIYSSMLGQLSNRPQPEPQPVTAAEFNAALKEKAEAETAYMTAQHRRNAATRAYELIMQRLKTVGMKE